jgi:lysyl-tRNA synthetase class 2
MQEDNELFQVRKQKVTDLRGRGINPYGTAFEVGGYARDLHEKHGETAADALEADKVSCVLAGRVIALRNFGKAAFAHIQDASGRIQVYMKKDMLSEDEFLTMKQLDIGDHIGVQGHLFRTKTDELTVLVEKMTFLSKSLRTLPEKWHGLTDVETRYRQRYVDLIVNPDVRETFRKRTNIMKAIRRFFDSKGFMEVETPMMQPVPGGATARPFITHHNALDMDLYLRIAPELYLKRLIVGGFDKVYEINRNFRNEGISIKHNPEFTMVEFYAAYKDYHYLMEFTEELVTTVAQEALGTLKITYQGDEIDLTAPWARHTLEEAIVKYTGVDPGVLKEYDRAVAYCKERNIALMDGMSLAKVVNEIFEKTTEFLLINPTFITDYPVELSPLSRRNGENPEMVDRFELFIAGRETANAFSELNDPQDQKERFQEQVAEREKGDVEAQFMDEDYVRALEYGMPPTAGEGIGIDRLVMLLTDSASIRDVILFPQLRAEYIQRGPDDTNPDAPETDE